jgi:hypothetical protein
MQDGFICLVKEKDMLTYWWLICWSVSVTCLGSTAPNSFLPHACFTPEIISEIMAF